MLFDHDSPASLRERASLSKKNALDSGSLPIVASAEGYNLTPDDLKNLESNLEALQKLGGVAGVARALKADVLKGLDVSTDNLGLRAEVFGTNTYPVQKSTPFWKFVWEALQDETLIILVVCAAVSLVVGLTTEKPSEGWYDGGGICFAIVLCVMVASVSDYQQSIQFQRLSAEKRKIFINVSRSSKRDKISIFKLLVGDIVHLSIGDQIPADGILIDGHSLLVDESSMTGESEPLPKDVEEKPFLMSGCKVLDGFGSMLVTAVGMHTEWGRVMATLSEDNDEETPLQVRLNELAATIGKVGLSVAVSCFIVSVSRLLAVVDLKHFSAANGRAIVDFFAVAVTIVVVAVPEGLPLAVTLSLAYSMKKMMNDKALVRHLAACETMGSATAICSDKTGTLTMNMMTVVNSWVCGKLREPTNLDESFKDDVVKLLFESICLNTNGNVHVDEGCGKPEVTGSPTEVAVLNWGVQLGANFCQVREETKVVEVNSFNSTKKRMGIIAKTSDGKAWVHWKGASEVVLEQCSHFIDVDGTINILTNDKIEELQGIITSFANAALRTLCLACNEIPPMEFAARTPKKQATDIPDSGLICLAIVGIKDPCRPGVPEAVAKCQQAGIKVRMVTGDNIMTAKAIAIECGILQENGRAIEGKVFREMSVDEQYKCLPSIQVMARSSPTDKYTMVKRLLEMGEIVAVTGDGTNDAPALHEASIGLAMGIAGTEVAKESSDIIIMDDNFSSIVKVVRWGRSVYSNIQKFVQFQTTVNGVALTLNFVAAIVKGSAPLTAVQLLWVNLIMDTMGAVALATEPPNDSLMDRPPIGRREPLITNVMWRNIIGQVIYQLLLLVLFQFDGFALLDLKHSATVTSVTGKKSGKQLDHADKELITIIFNTFVFCQVFNEMNARSPEKINIFKGFLTNRLFLYVITFTCLVQVLLVEFVGSFTSTVKLSWKNWLLCVGLGAVSLPLAAFIKCIPVPETPFVQLLMHWIPKRNVHKKKHEVLLRRGRSVKGMMVGRKSSLTSATKPSKFYNVLDDESTSPASPAIVKDSTYEKSQNCVVRIFQACCPSEPMPTASSYPEIPNRKNSNIAWD